MWDMVQKSYDIAYEPEDCELLYLEELISRERNQELKTALQDLDVKVKSFAHRLI